MSLTVARLVRRPASVIRKRYRELRRQRHERRFRSRWRTGHYAGFQFDIFLADTTGERWYGRDWPEFPESDLLRRSRLRPGATVFDLGAHHGVVALTLAREVGPDGRVIAVEGSQWNADVARWNAERNGVPNLNVVYSAVSDHEGTVRFADRASSNSNGRILDSDAVGSVEVPSTTVDKLAGLYGLPDVLYVDVEGFELAVLHGAEEALEGRPDLMIEVHVGCGLEAAGGSSDELLKLLTGLGYELWVHDEVDICVPEPIDRHPDIQRGRFFITAVADTSPAGSHASR